MAEWKRVRLGEIGRIVGGATPSTKNAAYYDGDIPWITPKDLSVHNAVKILKGERTITEDGLKSCSAQLLPRGTILFSSRAPIGYVALADCELCTNQGFKSLIPSKGLDSLFGYYLLLYNRAHIENLGSGTTFKEVSGSTMRDVEVIIPPLPTQRKIAAVLGAIDDKIETNRKICANLEAQAQALFKSWFVDFEPFGGKMPKGWKIGKLGDIVESMLNGDWGKDESGNKNDMPVYCIRGADIPSVNNGDKGKMPLRYILPKHYAEKKLSPGDIVVEISGGSPTQSTGRSALITSSLLSRYNRGMVCTNFCKAIKPRSGCSFYLYYLWRHLYNKGLFFSFENGTTGIKNLDVSAILEEVDIVIPTPSDLKSFEQFLKDRIGFVYEKGLENEDLAAMRDALLPKLMSGEIDVSKVEVA